MELHGSAVVKKKHCFWLPILYFSPLNGIVISLPSLWKDKLVLERREAGLLSSPCRRETTNSDIVHLLLHRKATHDSSTQLLNPLSPTMANLNHRRAHNVTNPLLSN
ncbi:unnamed protein product [Linum trigynum]|uniref:Uncharacterized protein n=1 Tax=Linum trigynum TaxID=586398 RepID=A0AAV2GFS1_9ROSI